MHAECTAPEVWRPVVGYEGWYSVSSFGRVRREMAAKGATVGHVLTPRLTRWGYLEVRLSRPDRRRKVHVHQLVAVAFLGPVPPRREVNHRDGDRQNNRAANLEYMTRWEHLRHGRLRRLPLTGIASNGATLTFDDVREIRASPDSVITLAWQYGVDPGTIYAIRAGRTWQHVR